MKTQDPRPSSSTQVANAGAGYKLTTVDSRNENPFVAWDKALLAALKAAPLPADTTAQR